MNILIIGGTRFIGPPLVELLHHQNHQVTLFHRGKTKHSFSFSVNEIHGERAILFNFREQFSLLLPDIVIDMISYTEDDALQLIKTFRGIAKHLIVLSSCDVYQAYDRLCRNIPNELVKVPLHEQSELRENFYPYRKLMAAQPNDWIYNYEKILVENIIHSCSDFKSTIFRLPMVYGPGDYSRIQPYLKKMDRDEPILLDEKKANWRVCRGYVTDIANAIALSISDMRDRNRIYNVGEEYSYSEFEWINLIGTVACWQNKIMTRPSHELPAELQEPLAFEQDLTIDTSLIRRELLYKELCSPHEAIKKSIEWLRHHPMV